MLESFLQAIKRSSSLTTVSLPNCSAIGGELHFSYSFVSIPYSFYLTAFFLTLQLAELQQSWLVDLFGEGTTADWLPAVQKHMVSNALRYLSCPFLPLLRQPSLPPSFPPSLPYPRQYIILIVFLSPHFQQEPSTV